MKSSYYSVWIVCLGLFFGLGFQACDTTETKVVEVVELKGEFKTDDLDSIYFIMTPAQSEGEGAVLVYVWESEHPFPSELEKGPGIVDDFKLYFEGYRGDSIQFKSEILFINNQAGAPKLIFESNSPDTIVETLETKQTIVLRMYGPGEIYIEEEFYQENKTIEFPAKKELTLKFVENDSTLISKLEIDSQERTSDMNNSEFSFTPEFDTSYINVFFELKNKVVEDSNTYVIQVKELGGSGVLDSLNGKGVDC